jgi:hydroxypyruvate isomerase
MTGGWSVHLSMLFTELPLVERPAAARAAGFSAVETWWPGAEAEAWAEAVREAGVRVALLNSHGGDIGAGDRGFLNRVEERERELGRIDEAVSLAARVGCTRVNVLAGRFTDTEPESRQRDAAVYLLREAGPRAAAQGVVLVVEALNALDVPGYLVPTAAAARRFLEAVGSDSVQLLYDAYHAARSGSDPIAEAPRFVDVIGHVQYADHPGRGAPGTGTVDLRTFADALREAGYEGDIGLEFDPHGDTSKALASVPR